MSEMGSHDPFEHLKHKLWPKEKLGVKFDFRPLKVENHPDFLACMWCATYRWKALNQIYNFSLDLISIGGLHTKLWAPNPRESQLWELTGSPETKCHLDAGPVANHRIYYKGEGGGFPQVWAMVSLVSSSLSMAPKEFQLCTNRLVVWFVQVRVND